MRPARGGPVAEHVAADLQVLCDRERAEDTPPFRHERQAKRRSIGALTDNASAVEANVAEIGVTPPAIVASVVDLPGGRSGRLCRPLPLR